VTTGGNNALRIFERVALRKIYGQVKGEPWRIIKKQGDTGLLQWQATVKFMNSLC